MALLEPVKRFLDIAYKPDGYNLCVNAGEYAGQTVMHAHLHVIPRYKGDVADPRGGLRNMLPGKGAYPFSVPNPNDVPPVQNGMCKGCGDSTDKWYTAERTSTVNTIFAECDDCRAITDKGPKLGKCTDCDICQDPDCDEPNAKH
jgi:hypothetical protein